MTLQQNTEHEFGRTGWWAMTLITTNEQHLTRDAVWRRWGNGVTNRDGREIITRHGKTPREMREQQFLNFIGQNITDVRMRIAEVFPNTRAEEPFAPWETITDAFGDADLKYMVLWESEHYLYYTRVAENPAALNKILRERYAYILKRDFGFPFVRIAAMLGLRGESTARAYANRFVRRTGAPRLTADGGERRRIAGQTAANRRWNGATVATPVIPTKPKLGRTFGVEIEYGTANMLRVQEEMQRALGVQHIHVFQYHGDTCLSCRQPVTRAFTEWKIEHDSSVTRGMYPRAIGGEIVSPILRGTDGFDQITKVLKAVRTAGGTINKKCGLHVHVDMRNLTPLGRAKVVTSWQAWQNEIAKIVAKSRHNNHYCRMLNKNETDYWVRQIKAGNEAVGERYRTLNMTPFRRIGTYEFRLHQGTLNAAKVIGWVKFLIAFAEMAAADGDAEMPVTDGIARINETIEDLLNMLVKRHGDTNAAFGLREPDANFIKRRVAQTTNTTR